MTGISIEDNNLYKDYSYLKSLLKYTLKKLKVKNAVFSVIFVDENKIKEINKEYRNINEITDVISFAFEDIKNNCYNKIRLLGDIYICIPRMKNQAINYGHSEKRELSFLCIHGLLHLLGYNHMDKEDEIEMFQLQEMILNGKNIKR